jgi:bifunctional non-homologous end joining protein LigD
MAGAMQTPDGAWRVEVYRQPRSRLWWYRLVHTADDSTVEGLSIGSVQRLLDEAGYDIADLIDCPPPGEQHEEQADEIA